MAYCSLSDVRAYLKFSGTDPTTDDALITSLISRAQQIIDATCHRRFEAATATKHYDVDRARIEGQTLYLDDDLLSVTSLTNGDSSTISSSDYWLEPRNSGPPYSLIRLKSTAVWTFNTDGEIAVAGSWGWAATAPADIQHACIRLTTWLYRQKDSSADVNSPTVTMAGTILMPGAMPKDVTLLLAGYRRWGV